MVLWFEGGWSQKVYIYVAPSTKNTFILSVRAFLSFFFSLLFCRSYILRSSYFSYILYIVHRIRGARNDIDGRSAPQYCSAVVPLARLNVKSSCEHRAQSAKFPGSNGDEKKGGKYWSFSRVFWNGKFGKNFRQPHITTADHVTLDPSLEVLLVRYINSAELLFNFFSSSAANQTNSI